MKHINVSIIKSPTRYQRGCKSTDQCIPATNATVMLHLTQGGCPACGTCRLRCPGKAPTGTEAYYNQNIFTDIWRRGYKCAHLVPRCFCFLWYQHHCIQFPQRETLPPKDEYREPNIFPEHVTSKALLGIQSLSMNEPKQTPMPPDGDNGLPCKVETFQDQHGTK